MLFKLSKKILSLLTLGLMLGTAVPVVAQSNTAVISDLKNKIENHNSQIQQLDGEIKQYQVQIEQVGKEANTLQSAVKELDITQRKLGTELKVTETNISKTSLSIEKLNLEITNSERQIRVNNDAVAKGIRDLAYIENDTLLETILAYDNVTEIWDDVAKIGQLQTGLKASTDTLHVYKADLEDKKSQLEGEKSKLVGLKGNLSDQKQVIDINKKEKSTLLTQTKSKESEYKRILEEKQRQKEQFEQDLFAFESQLQFALDPSKLPATGSGALSWPLDSIFVTQQFGRTIDSARLYVSGTHNGMDFRAVRGTPIKAARTGTVQAVGNTDAQAGCYSYGKWILVRHDNGLTTLYAHLDLIRVQANQAVQTGEIIGYSGQTGYSTGPHLHFTVYASEAVQVQQYTSSRNCKNVTIPIANSKAYLDPADYLPKL